ncbi:hypothetical protein NUM3379_13130 [Kineococcus sp. NUM-3379]
MPALAESRPAVDAPRDRARQVVVAAAAVVAVLGAVVGSGALGGTPIAEAAGGALSASATLVAPAGPAFAIWSAIYLGLLALAAWQLAPGRRGDRRQRATGWWVAASMLLNAAWIATVQAGQLASSVVVIVALLLTLVVVVGRLGTARPARPVEALVVDGTVGLYLGWVSIATVANVAAALAAAGVGDLGLGVQVWAVLVLLLAAGVGVGVTRRTGGGLAFAAGLAWGLAWVAVGRASGPDASAAVAVVAALASAVVLGSAAAARSRRAAGR